VSGTARSARTAGGLAAALVGLLGRSLRLRVAGLEHVEPCWRAAHPLIYAVWHGGILLVPWLYARLRRRSAIRPVVVLASRSRDGDLVSAYAERFGLGTVRGSSSRAGTAAARALLTALRAGRDAAIAPDGPRGPARVLRPGVVTLAALAGAAIVPLGVAARPARRLDTWDRFLLPLPLARAAVVFGEPIAVAGGPDRAEAVGRVQAALEEATARAEAAVAR
jgi:lysophospholipid acyltransferase (LPLAT)-like uncharacterized protein